MVVRTSSGDMCFGVHVQSSRKNRGRIFIMQHYGLFFRSLPLIKNSDYQK